jgi:Flp pilus assembly pilin Flp
MKKITQKFRKALNQRGQGAIEYILLLVVVVTIGLMFRKQIEGAVGERLTSVTDSLRGFNVTQ